jgi:hypothetical protein
MVSAEQPPENDDDPDVRALAAFIESVSEFRRFEPAVPSKDFQITLKKPIREALRLEKTEWYMYGAPRLGLALLVAAPLPEPEAQDEFIARVRAGLRQAEERAAGEAPDPGEPDSPGPQDPGNPGNKGQPADSAE